LTTPETYLGRARAEGWVDGPTSGLHEYGDGSRLPLKLNEFSYGGTWTIDAQPALAGPGATIDAEFRARRVYLVLGSAGETPRPVEVLLDGRPIPAADAGADVHGGRLIVRGERLYGLVSLPGVQSHRLSLRFAPGVTGYSFTFG
jgi:hypothetical protein